MISRMSANELDQFLEVAAATGARANAGELRAVESTR
jgi:hypothetical protein